jgi:hypothetical protein
MNNVPAFENTVVIADDPVLAARISSLFGRPGRYLPVMDGPRMVRPDWSNEVVRRRNAIVMTGARHVLLGGLPQEAAAAMRPGLPNCMVSDELEEHVQALRGSLKRPPKGVLAWGTDNLGIGVYLARLARRELEPSVKGAPHTLSIDAGRHLLVACERGDPLAEVTSANLAFASGASFHVFSELPEDDRLSWLDAIYDLGNGGNVTEDFDAILQRARTHLGKFDFGKYKTVLFVTAGFPWGLSVPETPTTHMYRYPDFGRAVVEGLWASQSAERSARTALLVDPQTVAGSELSAIKRALLKNGTLTRVVRGPAATKKRVQFMLDLIPQDIVVLSSHSGDAPGERITYEYPDADGRQRRLVVDRAMGFSYDRFDDKVNVMTYHRFVSLDGVDWRDKQRKAALPVGSAILRWDEIVASKEDAHYVVDRRDVSRVAGSMAIRLHDGNWLFASHGFAPGSAPLIINNSCWSWHELSERFTFAGARGYVGSLFPITEIEAQAMGEALFSKHLGETLPKALWLSQRDVYGASPRRPYVMVGIPFVVIRPNTTDAVSFTRKAYLDGISQWTAFANDSLHQEFSHNARRRCPARC